MSRACPRCAVACVVKSNAGVEVDLCGSCGGVFLDQSEFDALIAERFGGTRVESLFAVMTQDVEQPLHCPSCQAAMQQVVYEEIEIDRCPDCEGIWIDGHERQEFARRAQAAAAPQPEEFVPCGGCFESVPKRACIRRMDEYWCEACVVAGQHPGPEAALVGVAEMQRGAALAMAKGRVRQAASRESTKDRKASQERMRRRFKPMAQDGATLEIIARFVNRVLDKFS